MTTDIDETMKKGNAYIAKCTAFSHRLKMSDFPKSLRDFSISEVCSGYDSFVEFTGPRPRAHARIFIMNLADFDLKNNFYETKIFPTELKNIYLEWYCRRMEDEPAH